MPNPFSLSNLADKLGRRLTARLAFTRFDSNTKSNSALTSGQSIHGYVDVNSICAVISPFESTIISLQKLLIWEDPPSSLIALAVFNFVYWFVVYMNGTLFSTICLFAFTIKLHTFWTQVIWPEISLPPPPDADREGWTTVHPQVFSAPELSRHLKNYIEKCIWFTQTCYRFRLQNRGLFCVIVSSTLLTTAYLGCKFSGAVIVYNLLMSLALAPGVFLYLLPEPWKETVRELVQSCSADQVDHATRADAMLAGSSGDCSSPELVAHSLSRSSSSSKCSYEPIELAKNVTPASRADMHTDPSNSSPTSSSRLEQFLMQSIASLESVAMEQLQQPFGRLIHETIERKLLTAASTSATDPNETTTTMSSSPTTASQNPSRKSSQSSVQSIGIRFIASHFSSRASSSSDLNEFELVSESECEQDASTRNTKH